ncbi:response regulator transcription factor [Marinicella sp. S1101]|uniref:response regulator transcription factor n=1 Tax=Marinicella marina TaxID=2996016 RepID=UPI002260FC87|nr:response regulator transcription factor [Marinicella marina]MCX7552875.1 response regulator transcription factor [Marinicella marina]MDJ1139816.1 response regulator transcription factor [Marinicella marina]
MKIFILEDDVDQAELISHWLQEKNHECQSFTNGRDFIAKVPYEQPDLLVLDWNLPGISGLEVLNWVRSSEYSDLPVIFVTTRNHEDDLVRALDQGADDYLVKPIKQSELIARSHALYRRHNQAQNKLVSIEPFTFNHKEGTISFNGNEVKLTAKEFQLANYFFSNQDRLISRDYLLETIWTKSASITTRTVDTHISRLRKKLALDGSTGWKLVSVYHKGYRLIEVKTE